MVRSIALTADHSTDDISSQHPSRASRQSAYLATYNNNPLHLPPSPKKNISHPPVERTAMATAGPPPKFIIDTSALDVNPRPLKRRRRDIVPDLPQHEDAPDVLPAEMVAGLLNRSTAVIMKSMGFDGATAIAQERLRQLAEDCKSENRTVQPRRRFTYVVNRLPPNASHSAIVRACPTTDAADRPRLPGHVDTLPHLIVVARG